MILPQNRVTFKTAAVCFPRMPSVGSSCGRDLDEVEAAEGGGACAGVAVDAVDLSTVDFTALGPGKFETIGNELGAWKSGDVRYARGWQVLPTLVALLLSWLCSSSLRPPRPSWVPAVWWQRTARAPHTSTYLFTEKANGSCC